jgi:hypothetical protein
MDIYVDRNGYERYIANDLLVHRVVAFNEIYLLERDKYRLPFSHYQVHHRNGNKRDNRPENLNVIIKFDHEDRHDIESMQLKLPLSYDRFYAAKGLYSCGR